MSDLHDFSDTVVAVLDREPDIDKAASKLRSAGFEFEILQGADGKQHLDPEGSQGPVALVKRLINALGDEYRILDRLNKELDEGKYVVSVEVESDDAPEAIEILQDHGGEFLWKFGSWTFTRIGDDS